MHENRCKRFAASLSVRPIGSLVDLWSEPVNESGIAGMICIWQNVCFDGKDMDFVSISGENDYADDQASMYRQPWNGCPSTFGTIPVIRASVSVDRVAVRLSRHTG